MGFICGQCHYISLESNNCPLCGGKISKVENIVDKIIEEVLEKKIKIKQLFHSHKDFDWYGVGAFLKNY